MTQKRCFLEMGMGVDMHGAEYTKAARRAVEDAIHRYNLLFLGPLGVKDPSEMEVEVTVAVPQPDKVNIAEVMKVIPKGKVSCKAVSGGHEVRLGDDPRQITVIAVAAVLISLNTR
ncbi:MAG: Lin0512 family protein [Chloroflexi bacterium]|nr:Lin0512 family protein [Chloroflexota bacterium]